jgi:hypothetical protein
VATSADEVAGLERALHDETSNWNVSNENTRPQSERALIRLGPLVYRAGRVKAKAVAGPAISQLQARRLQQCNSTCLPSVCRHPLG